VRLLTLGCVRILPLFLKCIPQCLFCPLLLEQVCRHCCKEIVFLTPDRPLLERHAGRCCFSVLRRKAWKDMLTLATRNDTLNRETRPPREELKWCPGCNCTRTLEHFTPLSIGVPYYRPYCNQCVPPPPHRRRRGRTGKRCEGSSDGLSLTRRVLL
jgi:hypothetical protein